MAEPDKSLDVTLTLLDVELINDMDRQLVKEFKALAEHLVARGDIKGSKLLEACIRTTMKSDKIIGDAIDRKIKGDEGEGSP